jgi:hypothetical protein
MLVLPVKISCFCYQSFCFSTYNSHYVHMKKKEPSDFRVKIYDFEFLHTILHRSKEWKNFPQFRKRRIYSFYFDLSFNTQTRIIVYVFSVCFQELSINWFVLFVRSPLGSESIWIQKLLEAFFQSSDNLYLWRFFESKRSLTQYKRTTVITHSPVLKEKFYFCAVYFAFQT